MACTSLILRHSPYSVKQEQVIHILRVCMHRKTHPSVALVLEAA